MTKILKFSLAAMLLALLSAASGWSVTVPIEVVTTGASPGLYDYGLSVPFNTFVFYEGDQITFTGLSDVTGDSIDSALSDVGFVADGFTSSSATFTLPITSSTIYAPALDLGDFVIDSPVTTLGTIVWTITGPNGTATGSYDVSGGIQGPVGTAPTTTPEPSSTALLLAGLGALSLVALAGNRRAQARVSAHD